jgi:2-methylcitrate dehydratase PrpD
VLLDGLGERFLGEQVSFKAWPACRGTHAYIESALALRSQLKLADIERIALTGPALQMMLMTPTEQKRAPRTAIDAKFSLPFTMAAALVHGHVGLDDFTPGALKDREVLALARRVEYEIAPDWPVENIAGGRTLIVMRDGTSVSHAVDQALGHPNNPLSEAALRAKFLDCAQRAANPFAAGELDRLAARILDLESESDVGSLF